MCHFVSQEIRRESLLGKRSRIVGYRVVQSAEVRLMLWAFREDLGAAMRTKMVIPPPPCPVAHKGKKGEEGK